MVSARMVSLSQDAAHDAGGWLGIRTGEVNVHEIERLASGVGGGALALYGLKHGGVGGLALALIGGALAYRGATGHCHLYEALGVNTAEPEQGESSSVPAQHGFRVEHVVTISRSPEDLYRFWRNFENLPRFMAHLESVQVTGEKTSHWVARAPLGGTVSWDAEIHTEQENRLIAWRSLDGSDVNTAGSVHFTPAPGGRGTEVRVNLKYDPPAGKLGAAIARLFGESPDHQVREDLRRFKQVMEAGEIPTTQGQPTGP